MQYRKKPVVVDAFQYNGDLRNPDGEYRILFGRHLHLWPESYTTVMILKTRMRQN